MHDKEAPGSPLIDRNAAAAAVLEAVRSIRFGSVEVMVHDGRIVAIEKREKVRIDKNLGR